MDLFSTERMMEVGIPFSNISFFCFIETMINKRGRAVATTRNIIWLYCNKEVGVWSLNSIGKKPSQACFELRLNIITSSYLTFGDEGDAMCVPLLWPRQWQWPFHRIRSRHNFISTWMNFKLGWVRLNQNRHHYNGRETITRSELTLGTLAIKVLSSQVNWK